MPMDMRPESVQKMMLTPKMLLNMHVLQLQIMDLRVFIEAELEENPILEEEVVSESLPDDNKVKLEEELSRLIDDDVNNQDLVLGDDKEVSAIDEEKERYLESLATKKESLYEHLYWQLQVLARDDEEKRIGEFIIGSLDDNGFINMNLEEMRQLINADLDSFRHALTLIRSFDPAGVGARNLREALLIQLVSSGKADTHLYRIVYSYLDDLEKGNYEKIARALSIPVKQVEIARNRISYLSPRPASSFGGEEAISVTEPDVFLNMNNDGYSVEVSERDLPRLTINRYYRNILKNKNMSVEAKEYINKKSSAARWFIDALNQRKKTITHVCEYLVDAQRDFLEKGDAAIKPLTLKQVADALFVSEATVSRVVSNKYAQMFNRLFTLKSFFAGQLKTIDGGIVADRTVKEKILGLIESENTESPISDGAITSILKKEGIKISRRTVTKYRESLKILSHRLRKKNIDKSQLYRGG